VNLPPRLRELWRYDLVRQSAIAFLCTGVITAIVIMAALVLDLGSDPLVVDGALVHRDDAVRISLAAQRHAAAQAQLDARAEAARERRQLAAVGSRGEGYALLYDQAWNDAISEAVSYTPRQSQAALDGTQWIELRR